MSEGDFNNPVFENGRQHVIADIKRTYQMRLKFLERIKDQTEGITYSIENRLGQIEAYNQILDTCKRLEKWNTDRNMIAATTP